MRLLHTSDWHLGRSLHREDLLCAQAAFIDFLVATVRDERIDTVLIAGDIYDRALPGVDAVALCNDALRRLVAEGARVVLISGNHDSARRLGFAADLLDAAGVHVRTDPRRCGVPVLLEDVHGAVAIYGIPYLEPEAVRADVGCEGRSHDAVLHAAMQAVRADLATRSGTARSVTLAHAFVAGGAGSDSERDITVGGALAVSAGIFAGIDYVALGHLHGPQALSAGLRYSGSPLAYSFSEARQAKSVQVVELDRHGLGTVRSIPCPVPRPLACLRGSLEQLLTSPEYTFSEGSWVSAVLTDPVRPREPMERLRRRFPHVLVLGFEPEGGLAPSAAGYAQRLRGRSDLEIGLGFVEHVRGAPADPAEAALLREAMEAGARAEPAGAGVEQ